LLIFPLFSLFLDVFSAIIIVIHPDHPFGSKIRDRKPVGPPMKDRIVKQVL
jgi:hypothetical protein